MNELVFIEPKKPNAEPFTTSDIIAEYSGNSYRSVQRIIEKKMERLKHFGRVRFEITPLQTRGGVQNHKVYHLNEQQATLLMTFLKSTEAVDDFKEELVRQFYLMRMELQQRQESRAALKPIRRELTDAIRDYVPESPHKRWAYKQYTDLAYKSTLGATAAQLRKQHGAPKSANIADYLSADELTAVTERQYQISALLKLGLDYPKIKDLLLASAKLAIPA